VAGIATRRGEREIFRRSRRIAGFLNGQSHDEEIVRSICELLAQEGDLVGRLVEEIAARSFQRKRASADRAPASGAEGRSPSLSQSAP
jgi:hypothetical protein